MLKNWHYSLAGAAHNRNPIVEEFKSKQTSEHSQDKHAYILENVEI